eukprot:4287778-Prymnesium_polylepis.1
MTGRSLLTLIAQPGLATTMNVLVLASTAKIAAGVSAVALMNPWYRRKLAFAPRGTTVIRAASPVQPARASCRPDN